MPARSWISARSAAGGWGLRGHHRDAGAGCSARRGRGVAQGAAAHSTLPLAPARVFWDVDNVRPGGVEHALVAAHRLCQAVRQLTGAAPDLVAFANEVTLGPGGPGKLGAALQLMGGRLVPVKLRSQSADLAMRSEMLRCIESSSAAGGVGGCLACVSFDQGFAPIMRYAASRGVYTICIGTPPRKPPAWVINYDYGRRYPLCAACHLTLLWSFGGSGAPLAPVEREVLTRWREGAGAGRAEERGLPQSVVNGEVIAAAGLPGADSNSMGEGSAGGSLSGEGGSKSRERKMAACKGGPSRPGRQRQFSGRVVGAWANPGLPQPPEMSEALAVLLGNNQP